MSEYIVPEQDIWKLPDGKVWEGVRADLPVSQADIIAKAGKEYPVAHLKEQGWKKAAKKAAPAKKKAQKPAENKAAKVEKKDK
tara:strand:- start:314 stop:562 length:249 start_codon:yes stop_codon:yes gene_type:complete